MAKLTDDIKEAIVARLAQFHGYAEVARDVGEAFGVELSRFHVRAYDASSYGFVAGERWREKFWMHREAYLIDVSAVPIAHTAFRLNQLQTLFWSAKSAGNLVMAAQLLRQAAEEAARYEQYKPAPAVWEKWPSEDERHRMLKRIVGRAMGRLKQGREDAQSDEVDFEAIAKAG